MILERLVTIDVEDGDLTAGDWQKLGTLARETLRSRRHDRDLTTLLATAEALLVGLGVEVDRAMLEAAPRLRYVGVLGTSVASIDPRLDTRRITVRNVPGYATEAVAELAVGVVLDALRDLTGARSRAARGDLAEARLLGRELRSVRVGVLGLGAIGRRVLGILHQGFGADVRAWSRTPRPELGRTQVSLEAVLAHAEVLVVCLALTSETRAMLDAPRLDLLPEGATIVHLCPAAILSMDALRPRLAAGTLRLVTDHGDELAATELAALRACPACTLYPPIGYATREAMAARSAYVVTELEHFLRTT